MNDKQFQAILRLIAEGNLVTERELEQAQSELDIKEKDNQWLREELHDRCKKNNKLAEENRDLKERLRKHKGTAVSDK